MIKLEKLIQEYKEIFKVRYNVDLCIRKIEEEGKQVLFFECGHHSIGVFNVDNLTWEDACTMFKFVTDSLIEKAATEGFKK